MLTKADRTTQYIIETVAPVFNKNGYVGTSMSALEKATGLTKGAIYGNFTNKEELALEAFNYNVRKVINAVALNINAQETATGKLLAMTNYYRQDYIQFVNTIGGCPFLNVGLDSLHMNNVLYRRVKEVVSKLLRQIAEIIELGKRNKEFKAEIDATAMANTIFALIEGGIYLRVLHGKHSYLSDIIDQVDDIILNKLKQ